MTKAELIKKYGVEWREAHKAKSRKHNNERYHTDPEFREAHNAKNTERYHTDPEFREAHNAKNRARNKCRYCKGWTIHHRLEIRDDYINTREDLIMMNLYYNRPPEELIFLTRSDHMKLHRSSRHK